MKNLARRIKREFGVQTGKRVHCAVYEDELQRIWPLTEKDRQAKIARFARNFGFELGFYKQGYVPFLRRSRRANGVEKLALHLELEAGKNPKAWFADRVGLIRNTKPNDITGA